MKFSVIGGGTWGTTLAQVLYDNGHETLIYDINPQTVDAINHGKHPFLTVAIPGLKATVNLKDAIEFSNSFLLSVPTAYMRDVLKEINNLSNEKMRFINVSKGIEPHTLKRVSEIVQEEISADKYEDYAVLTGPSHAEEVILRKVTLLTVASNNPIFAKEVQTVFNNENYLRIYTSDDLIGCEVGGSVKNAIALVSGVLTGYGLGENARAALITRGILEIARVVVYMGGKKETAFGLAGMGDLIVTASSLNSRNFMAGKRIGEGVSVDKVLEESKMTVEGIRTIYAMHDLTEQCGIELPIISVAYEVVTNKTSVSEALGKLLSRELKEENLD